MNLYSSKVLPLACTSLFLVFACALHAQSSALQSQRPAITLEPAQGLELQAHTFDTHGARLPEAPANFRRLGEGRVGEAADVHTLTFRFSATAKLTGIKSTKDFRIEPGGSCTEGSTYQVKSTCTLQVRFTPQGAGNRLGHVEISTDVSAKPMAFGLGGYGYAPILSFIPSQISTLPGSYPSSVGLLSGAHNLTIDGSDTLWVADTANNVIRNYDSSQTFKTLASGFASPWGIAVDTFGQAYFDLPSTGKMYEIYDYGPVVQASGAGTIGCPASSPCTLSSEGLGAPQEMSMDPYNHLFFVDNHQGAAFSTVQPTPANLIFLYDPFPYQTSPAGAMAVDSGDNLYSFWGTGGNCEIVQQTLYNAENSNVSFTKIAGGHTCGFAGDKGLAGNAEIGNKIGQIAFDAAGDLYFTDTANQRVRRIEYTTGVIRTVAGNGTAGYAGDGADATFATLNNPSGVAVDSQGIVYIISSATSGQVIRRVGPQGYLNYGYAPKGVPIAKTLVVTNSGNSSLVLSGTALIGTNASDFKINTSSTTCPLTAGGTIYSGQTCYISMLFTPAATGTRQATFRFLSNTVAGSNDTTLIGVGTLPSPNFKITSPTNGASFTSGTAVTFSVSVTYTSSPQPTGTVQFKVDGANYGSAVALSSTGTASTSVTGLTQTTHTLSATYSGDSNYAAAGPVSVSITVTAVKVMSVVSLSPGITTGSCSPAQFTVSVSSSSKTLPTGQVTLFDGGRLLTTATLTDGKAALIAPFLGGGSHSITAHYAGDALHAPAISPALIQVGTSALSCRPILLSPGPRTRIDPR
jgi:hypothetical protein